MDILLATLPWRLINKLTLNNKERIGVIVGMSLGSLLVLDGPLMLHARCDR
jgi:hypothetical protein